MIPRYARWWVVAASLTGLALALASPRAAVAAVTHDEVERAIRGGVDYLRKNQLANGSWGGQAGTTELALLALLTAGAKADDPEIALAIAFSTRQTPGPNFGTYAVALQTMALAAADPVAYQQVIARNAAWLERTQLHEVRAQRGRNDVDVGGSWTYHENHGNSGDNSNTQYALLGLNAASEAGVPIDPKVWALARQYWIYAKSPGGGWGYKPGQRGTASMTCAGIASLVITGQRVFIDKERLDGETILRCGQHQQDRELWEGITWLIQNFAVNTNVGGAPQWTLYYLYGLERAGRLTGQRYFGKHDWYREGAEIFVANQNVGSGAWTDGGGGPLVSTCFALLFLAKGRAPVLVNKVVHGGDWNNDRDDVRNLTDLVSRDWKHLVTWQVVDPGHSSTVDMLQAPISFFNGHDTPRFTTASAKRLRDYVDQGGFLFADACCGRAEFDRGFRALMEVVFPEPQYKLKVLPKEHPVYRSRHILTADLVPLWGIEYGCRTVVIYSPNDLSCYWNQMEKAPENPSVILSSRVGQNVVDYATGRVLPADKLDRREVVNNKLEPPRRGALEVAKLKHMGDWNVAPMAIPRLMNALRERSRLDVVVNHREVTAADPNLVNFPLVYIHGRSAMSLRADEQTALRRQLEPGGGMIFADAACGSAAFDESFRKLMTEMFPDNPLTPIPTDDDVYSRNVGYDLADVQYTRAAGGKTGYPQLEGIRLNGHWAVVYSKLDIGCSLESPQGVDCKGYVHESAVRIATNIVQYSMLP